MLSKRVSRTRLLKWRFQYKSKSWTVLHSPRHEVFVIFLWSISSSFILSWCHNEDIYPAGFGTCERCCWATWDVCCLLEKNSVKSDIKKNKISKCHESYLQYNFPISMIHEWYLYSRKSFFYSRFILLQMPLVHKEASSCWSKKYFQGTLLFWSPEQFHFSVILHYNTGEPVLTWLEIIMVQSPSGKSIGTCLSLSLIRSLIEARHMIEEY